ncbi:MULTISPECIES: hypothetical protein [unclassified Mesorhizobium]|uniref:hypothetical protein n=1 Tax=Mesorhizobium sp. LSHC422A00 TaxID=1287294 RepID=UPI00041CBFD9|nr:MULTISPECIES: hypothetical protein [unclassified Mesorhizobium]
MSDNLGRDVFARTIFGARPHRRIAVGGMRGSCPGVLIGIIAGYSRSFTTSSCGSWTA